MQTIAIEEVDLASLTDEEIADVTVLMNAVQAEVSPEDPPTPVEQNIAQIRNVPAFISFHAFRATDAGRSVGWAIANWTNTDENAHLVGGGIFVHPTYRRRGLGTEFLGRIVVVTEAAGRSVIGGGTTDRVPASEAFCRAVGAEVKLVGHTNRLVLADVDRMMIRRWIDEGPARAPGYSLVTVDGPYPEELIDQIAGVNNVMNTAPRDDLDMEDSVVTVEQIREMDKMLFAMGSERWYVAARHDATGELVGFTELSWNPAHPETMSQGGTAVRPEHRGHALGKWLKAANVERVMRERPEVEDIRTHNADSNDAMLGINRALGFKPWRTDTAWQVRVDVAKAYLSAR